MKAVQYDPKKDILYEAVAQATASFAKVPG